MHSAFYHWSVICSYACTVWLWLFFASFFLNQCRSVSLCDFTMIQTERSWKNYTSETMVQKSDFYISQILIGYVSISLFLAKVCALHHTQHGTCMHAMNSHTCAHSQKTIGLEIESRFDWRFSIHEICLSLCVCVRARAYVEHWTCTKARNKNRKRKRTYNNNKYKWNNILYDGLV